MTIREAVVGVVSLEASDQTIDVEIINSNLDPDASYDASQKETVGRVACNVLSSLLSLKGLREGDLSINYDRDGILQRLLYIAKTYGFSDILDTYSTDKVRDRSDIW